MTTTKIQYSYSINPLTRRDPHISFSVKRPVMNRNQNQFYPETDQGCFTHLLDRIQDKESLKKTILKQEELFKQQVLELHRLYNVQKKLMNEMKIGEGSSKAMTDKAHVFSARDDPRELSGSCSGESSKRPILFDLERRFDGGVSHTDLNLFEEKKEMKRSDEETDVEVELTLSIGHSTSKKGSKSQLNRQESDDIDRSKRIDSSMKFREGEGLSGEPSSVFSSSSVSICQDSNKRPHWLMQDLNLHRT